jgi:hypothetical protein
VRTGASKQIRCRGLPGPAGPYVAFSDGLHVFDDDAAEALAQNGMMLSLNPAYAERLIHEGLQTFAAEPTAGSVRPTAAR